MEFFSLGHLVVLAVVALVLFFGWKQLPDMARSLGRSLRVFKTEIKGMTEDDDARTSARTDAKSTVAEPPAIEAPKVVRVQPEPRQPVSARSDTRPRPAPRTDSPAADRPASPS